MDLSCNVNSEGLLSTSCRFKKNHIELEMVISVICNFMQIEIIKNILKFSNRKNKKFNTSSHATVKSQIQKKLLLNPKFRFKSIKLK